MYMVCPLVVWEGGNNDATFPDSCCIGWHLDKPVNLSTLEGMTWETGTGTLNMIRQLVEEFGWDSMKGAFESYYNPEFPRDQKIIAKSSHDF